MNAADDRVAAGAQLGEYRMVAGLGHGGMADVHLALAQRAAGFSKLLVLKLLKRDLAQQPDFVEMFTREGRIGALFSHPNVVDTYEVGVADGQHFIAMEYLEGQPWSAVQRHARVPSLAMQVHVLVQVLSALHYVHELTSLDGAPLGLVHRDVSASNVFVTYDGRVKLVDFGIAKVVHQQRHEEHTRTGVIKGKVGYLAPEQIEAKNVDLRADLFSVGVLLWESMAGRRFVARGESDLAALQRRLTGEQHRVDELGDQDEALLSVCRDALAPDPERRFASALAMRERLEAWLEAQSDGETGEVGAKAWGRWMTEAFAQERSQVRRLVEAQAKRGSLDVEVDPSTPRAQTQSLVGEPPPRSRHRPGSYLLAGLLVAGATGSALHFGLRRSEPAVRRGLDGVPTSVAEGPSAPPAPPRAEPARVHVAIVATPPHARIAVDGRQVDDPKGFSAPRDATTHVVSVSAEGYVTEERTVAFDRDASLDVRLRRVMAFGRVVPSPRTPAVGAPLTQSPRVRRDVDDKDPYNEAQ